MGEWLRADGAGPWRPLGLGLALWAALGAAFVLWNAALGSLGALRDPDQPLGLSDAARTQVVVSLLIAFLWVTRRRLAARAPEHWAPLQPLTGLSLDAFRDFVREQVALAGRRHPLVDVCSAALGIAIVLLSTDEPELREGIGRPTLLWALALNAWVFVEMGRAATSSLLDRSEEALAGALRDLDLLDPAPLRCFGRHGLRQAFFWAGGSSIASLLAWNLDRVGPLTAVLALTLGLATFALLEPARVVQRQVRAAKRAERAVLLPRIRAARGTLLAGGEAGELPALLAWERRLDEVREWPFDTPTLLRFGALALLATGSWLGGALVERLLDALLG